MAKAKTAAVERTTRKPRKWPTSADLRPWLECYLDLCERHPKPSEAGVKACVPLKQLAECGHEAAALTRLQRLLDRLPAAECKAAGLLALTAVEIGLDLPDLRRAEKSLRLAESRASSAPPREQKPLQIRLNQVRTLNGLPEPPDSIAAAKDDPLRQLGRFRQTCRAALLAGDKTAAAKALQKITKQIPDVDQFWLKPGLTLSAITAFRRLGDVAALTRYVAWLDRNGHSSDLDTGSLWGMGLTDLANKRARDLVAARLKKLKRDSDSNVHFPVHDICEELWFFLQTGQPETAATLLQRVLRDLPHWPGLHGGFAGSGVLTELAELLAELDGPEAACRLLGLAVQAGRAEPDRGFRQGALKAAKKQLEAPGLAAAIAKARSIQNARKRRETLIPLLTKKAAWPELAALLDEITSADELLDSLHTVLFKLPGGARLA